MKKLFLKSISNNGNIKLICAYKKKDNRIIKQNLSAVANFENNITIPKSKTGDEWNDKM